MKHQHPIPEIFQNTPILHRVPRSTDFASWHHYQYFVPYFKPGLTVLDVGCGAGTFSFIAAEKGCIVTGVDISQDAISSCRVSAANLGLDVEFIYDDFVDMKIGKKYDIIICSEVLEHTEDSLRVMEKLYELLVDGGILLFSVPLYSAPLYRYHIWRFRRCERDKSVGHLRRYMHWWIVANLRHEGFVVQEQKLIEGLLRSWIAESKYGQLFRKVFGKLCIKRIVNWLDSLLIPIFGASNIIIIAKKRKGE